MPGWQRFIIVLLIGCWALPLSAQIYSWRDEQGRIHYSDKQPSQRSHETITPSSTSIMPMKSNIRRGNNISQRNSSKPVTGQNRKKVRSKRARSEQKLAKKCASYRTKIARLDRRLRAGYKPATGNRLRSQRRQVSQKLSWECLLK